ncbi:hypothetical protein [Actinokineospora bangkokensis]|uniref:Uncharacterized protein n=1 Tax=Actinokineospora bangkokensis TaxID=1193682 RepID=A0A1Q9LHX7_9PSEU|nr:hypothetical protein [Actinokineospora bangkokensis]OLR91652.1 hypothetical protein BJP25_26245 [Actinokineospora bangkokensis]
MLLSMPGDVVHTIPLAGREAAVREFAALLTGIRPGAAADLESLATEAVETALREGAVLLAVVTPEGAGPALLTGVPVDAPPTWDADSADTLRDKVEDLAGPDVRETLLVPTALGPAVIAQRVPGPEQARARRPLTLQLQAFIPEPGTGRMLLLTLASPRLDGWAAHQLLFGQIVSSAAHDPADDFGPVGTAPAPQQAPAPQRAPDPGATTEPATTPEPVVAAERRPRRRAAVPEEESYEFTTFRVT